MRNVKRTPDVLLQLLSSGPDTDTAWMRDGECGTQDPELFFPLGDGPAYAEQIAQAKRVCAGCPVLRQCREYGDTQRDGIWGRTTETERRGARAQAMREAAELRRQREEIAPRRDGRRIASSVEIGRFLVRLPGTRPTLEVARRALRDLLDALRMTDAAMVSADEVPDEFLGRVRGRAWVQAELQRLADLGELASTATSGVFTWPAAAELPAERRSA
ncbi:WhiB family transcriptional regulator [Amycolatopsis sp. PS_44_ISF1]|uniref:WhiB family transcriptional regulator n=1 Tax=Amycolatopsis sp. PS_44_ISF1 TaxID=2974917 RepID=UPI0037C14A51